MNQEDNSRTPATEESLKILRRLEARVARIENYLRLAPLSEEELQQRPTRAGYGPETTTETPESRETALEQRIGEFWLARVGIVALLLGIVFFIAYPFSIFPPIVPSLLGYVAVAGLLALSHHWRATFQHISRTLFGGGLILLYIATLRLHFFSANPVVGSKTVGLALLVAVLALHLFLAARRRSEFLASLAIVLGFATSLISDTTHFALSFVAVTSAISVFLLRQYNWQRLVNLAIVLAYATHLLWLLNNPLLGHPLGAVSEHQNNLIYLFAYATIFAAANMFHYQDPATLAARILRTLLNGFGFSILGNLVVITFFEQQHAFLNLTVSVFFLSIAVFYWWYRRSRYSTSVYACLGYLALTVAIIAQFDTPQNFVWLAWQSLLVMSTAIWFRSKIIVVANVFIFLGILLSYLFAAPATAPVNLSYALVALLSARILNWQKQRLEIRTELMRNSYLASAFVVIPYGLYHAVPKSLVSLSWLGAAVFYYLISLLLKNRKYRWMAILTIFITAVYAFAIDLAKLEAVYRMILFLALGLVLLVVSWLYARRRARMAEQKKS